jgi:hypothetical protein
MAKDRDRGIWPDTRGRYQQPSRPSQQVQEPRTTQPSSPAQRSGGPAGNERLTATTETALLIVLAAGYPAHDHGRRHGRADRAADGRAGLRRRAFALAEAWDGTAPADMGTGGSIPFIAEFQETFPARASSSRRRGPRHPHARPERGAPPARVRAHRSRRGPDAPAPRRRLGILGP